MKRFTRSVNQRSCQTAGLLLLSVSVVSGSLLAQLDRNERRFIEYLIYELKYHDTAQRLLDRLKKDRSADQADVAYYEVDLLQAMGDQEAYRQKLEEARRRFPRHSRSSLGDLPIINLAMGKVIAAFDKAKESSDPAEVASLRAEGRRIFQTEVQGQLDALIDSLNKQVEPLEKAFNEARRRDPRAPEPANLADLRRNRNLAEFARVKIYLIYARLLPPGDGEFREERQKMLEKGLEHATVFVEDRPDFYLMRYEAQLQKGLYELELGKLALAIDDLTILIGITPPVGRPRGGYPDELVRRFKEIHLQAILYAAKAYNRGLKFDRTVSLVERKMKTPTGDDFDLSTADQDPQLEKYYVLAELEQAVGLAGSGSADRGLGVVQSIITRYRERADGDPVAQAYVTDARKALGTMVELGGVTLNALAYYEGGLGLYSELREDEALTLFQYGLASVREDREAREVAPLCLDKIGEINYRRQRFALSTIAYLELCERFPGSELAPKAAQNALAAVTKLNQKYRDHAGYRKLEKQAEAVTDRLGPSSLTRWQAIFVRAQDLLKQEEFGEAREEFLKVPREENGEKIPFYWRAQVDALNCLVQAWLQRDAAERVETANEIRQVAEQLGKAVDLAKQDDQLDGAIMASFYQGQIHYELKEWEQVVAALEPFVDEYVEDRVFRAAALYFLVEASLELKQTAGGERAFSKLQADFAGEQSTLYATLLLAGHFSGLGGRENLKQAAEYIKIYVNHPLSKEELEDTARLMDAIDVLIDGGLLEEAEKQLRVAESRDTGSDVTLKNRILVRRANFAYAKEDYETVRKSLRQFIENYRPGDRNPDLPYIFQRYGEAHIRPHVNKAPPPGDAQTGERAYGYAVKLLDDLRQLGRATPKQEREFWEWCYRWLQIKWILYKYGDPNELSQIRVFWESRKGQEMGGEDLKKRFATLNANAEAEMKRRSGR